jgi:hypothetical protein
MDKDDFALLKVIASNVETIKAQLIKMENAIENKVDVADFHDLRKDVDELKKKSWFVAGIMSAISFFASHFLK